VNKDTAVGPVHLTVRPTQKICLICYRDEIEVFVYDFSSQPTLSSDFELCIKKLAGCCMYVIPGLSSVKNNQDF
jgi:hypothetical protein